MLDYTRAAIDKTIQDIKRTASAVSIGSQSVYIIYLIYALIALAGNIVINSILLALSVAYFIFYLVYFRKKGKDNAHTKRTARRAYKYSKLFLNAFTLGATVWGIYIAASNVSAVTVVLATLTAGSWLISVLIEIIVYFFESHIDLIMLGFTQDKRELTEAVTRPVTAVTDFIKRATGHELGGHGESESRPTRKMRLLDRLVSERKEAKEIKRANKKAERESAKANRKADVAAETATTQETDEKTKELVKK